MEKYLKEQLTALVILTALLPSLSEPMQSNSSRYGFYRAMGEERSDARAASAGSAGGAGGTRRVFGGAAATLDQFPGACALLDRYWAARCSATVVAPRWAITAAHCVSPRLAYVKYNTRYPAAPDGDIAVVQYLYRHPKYKVVQEDEGRGTDVTLLHHDIGLVRTRSDMRLAVPLQGNPLHSMRRYDPSDLINEEVQILGFGRTEQSSLGEELFMVQLRLVACERGAWFHCVCGVTSSGVARGVCAGDSGGPVLYKGVQVGVTSMGPLECAGDAAPPGGATSVFTALRPYAALVNATLTDADEALRMRMISRAHTTRRPKLLYTLFATLSAAFTI